ncbi:hypothetical protein E2C01_009629 [Portunus trituberculatus]|uniref:Secreted protein n=1 Tax=Portunus trituberculatus TaxID=210409 RepID=A0A5B7D684_PORTR|nr:hypothetical protein [Portunus trituberculatus]
METEKEKQGGSRIFLLAKLVWLALYHRLPSPPTPASCEVHTATTNGAHSLPAQHRIKLMPPQTRLPG